MAVGGHTVPHSGGSINDSTSERFMPGSGRVKWPSPSQAAPCPSLDTKTREVMAFDRKIFWLDCFRSGHLSVREPTPLLVVAGERRARLQLMWCATRRRKLVALRQDPIQSYLHSSEPDRGDIDSVRGDKTVPRQVSTAPPRLHSPGNAPRVGYGKNRGGNRGMRCAGVRRG